MNQQSIPENHGYKIGENIAPYINKCIDLTGECYLSEGTHIVGRNDKDWMKGNVWGDNIIQWGWIAKHNVKLIGVGYDKTILKFIDNIQSRYLLDLPRDYVMMLQTNYNTSCDNNLIQGITFDGNYLNNSSSSTIACIRIRGNNNTIDSCKFINFGVGDSLKHECFVVALGPIEKNGKGPTIKNCYFTDIGNKKNSPKGFVNETTLIAVGGYKPTIENNTFKDCFYDIQNQQSPVHGISLGNSTEATVTKNIFINFQGKCIYSDGWTIENAKIFDNHATNIWTFVHLTCQKWSDIKQIGFYKNILIENNKVILADETMYHQWDLPGYPTSFFSYIYDPNLNTSMFKGFENIQIKNNSGILGYIKQNNEYKYSNELICAWGTPVDKTKIHYDNSNVFLKKDLPQSEKISFLKKIILWFKRLFK